MFLFHIAMWCSHATVSGWRQVVLAMIDVAGDAAKSCQHAYSLLVDVNVPGAWWDTFSPLICMCMRNVHIFVLSLYLHTRCHTYTHCGILCNMFGCSSKRELSVAKSFRRYVSWAKSWNGKYKCITIYSSHPFKTIVWLHHSVLSSWWARIINKPFICYNVHPLSRKVVPDFSCSWVTFTYDDLRMSLGKKSWRRIIHVPQFEQKNVYVLDETHAQSQTTSTWKGSR